ncbi:MAG: hypothetical protein IPJ66_11880 [Bacteroidetes bacterium]|nr:hypothetical protein [Bacteroidota bacterium]
MGSGIGWRFGLIESNAVSLMLDCDSEEIKVQTLRRRKSEHPLENSFFGAVFGDLTDKYGNHWLCISRNHKNKTTSRNEKQNPLDFTVLFGGL